MSNETVNNINNAESCDILLANHEQRLISLEAYNKECRNMHTDHTEHGAKLEGALKELTSSNLQMVTAIQELTKVVVEVKPDLPVLQRSRRTYNMIDGVLTAATGIKSFFLWVAAIAAGIAGIYTLANAVMGWM